MRPSEVNNLIVTLLSSARKHDDPRHCVGLTCRQICNHLEVFLPPGQESEGAKDLMNQVDSQLSILESEFEVTSKGERRKTYRMSPPSLIVETEDPFRARFVGDRAYFYTVIELLNAECNVESSFIETSRSISESRQILEPRGIAVQTEVMLFQFLPDPALPNDIELSMSEQISDDDIEMNVEVYVPQRNDFFAKRWISFDEALPSEMSQLRRIKGGRRHVDKYETIYLWESAGRIYRLSKNQALLAMYRIDLDRNKSRLLDLDKPIPARIRDSLPVPYRLLVDRYTEETLDSQLNVSKDDSRSRYLEVRFRYKGLLAQLLEVKLGINKPLT